MYQNKLGLGKPNASVILTVNEHLFRLTKKQNILYILEESESSEDGGEYSGDGGDDGCFPSSARIYLENGNIIAMSELQIGDQVKTGKKSFVILKLKKGDQIQTGKNHL